MDEATWVDAETGEPWDPPGGSYMPWAPVAVGPRMVKVGEGVDPWTGKPVYYYSADLGSGSTGS
jgi:hypothetical protein